MFPSFLKTGLSRRNFLFLIFQPFLCVQFLSLALNPPRHFILFQLLILGCHGRFLFIQPSFLQPFPPGIPQHFPPTCPCSLFLPWQFYPFSGFHFHFYADDLYVYLSDPDLSLDFRLISSLEFP